ncbi:class I SAM-dependent methyltransferase [Paenibacillus xerothermodurans]|nr:nicotianamine synthase family protein [Paenibacillus xerothermodurans]
MRNKYELLLSIKLLDYEIRELTVYSKQCCDCYEMLTRKLDDLCNFMNEELTVNLWSEWGDDPDISLHSEQLRETAVHALCDMEKHQSLCIHNHETDVGVYMNTLSSSIQNELQLCGIGPESKVLFIGAGAFPLSALTIAAHIGAELVGVDIDEEAVRLAENMTQVLGLEQKVSFTSRTVSELAFARQATHVIIASLVPNKVDVLDVLYRLVRPDSRIIVRYGNGLRSLFNYPFQPALPQRWRITPVPNHSNLYDTVILQKAAAVGEGANLCETVRH